MRVSQNKEEGWGGKVGVNREGCRWEGKSLLPGGSIVEDICVNCGNKKKSFSAGHKAEAQMPRSPPLSHTQRGGLALQRRKRPDGPGTGP